VLVDPGQTFAHFFARRPRGSFVKPATNSAAAQPRVHFRGERNRRFSCSSQHHHSRQHIYIFLATKGSVIVVFLQIMSSKVLEASMPSPKDVGAVVWVKTWPEGQQESGCVLRVGCEYEDADGNVCRDGLMIKLQISNTRGIYAPFDVMTTPLEESSAMDSSSSSSAQPRSSRRASSRRVTVTPSPTGAALSFMDTTNGDTPTTNKYSEMQEEEKKQSSPYFRKRKLATDDKKQEVLIQWEDSDSNKAESPEDSDTTKQQQQQQQQQDNNDPNENDPHRIEYAKSDRKTKCQCCPLGIDKGVLRIQNAQGWWHVECADPVPFPEKMQGFDSLSKGDQAKVMKTIQRVRDHLEGEDWNDETSLEDSSDENNDNENKEDGDSDGSDYASSTLHKSKPSVNRESKPSVNKDDNENNNNEDGESDGSDYALDRPFRVDYAPTARATCRACDERIAKQDVRVSHRPLFRGKPGFVIYRHLKCAMFSQEIDRMQMVGGYKKLKPMDRVALAERIEESKFLLENESKEVDPDELVQAAFQGEMRTSPPGLSATLLPFQVEGVSWMYHQEVQVPEVRGGILADEMGMGKTIQTITTILDNRPKLQHSQPGVKHDTGAPDLEARKREETLWKDSLQSWDNEMIMANVPKTLLPKATKTRVGGGARAGTLVVCPVIALYQWKEEILKFTEANALTICTYHGPKKASEHPREMLCKYDIVLTTYQVLEADFRKMTSPNKVKCPNCGGKYKVSVYACLNCVAAAVGCYVASHQ
jgi:SNF2 family DNA or RNA helicase